MVSQGSDIESFKCFDKYRKYLWCSNIQVTYTRLTVYPRSECIGWSLTLLLVYWKMLVFL